MGATSPLPRVRDGGKSHLPLPRVAVPAWRAGRWPRGQVLTAFGSLVAPGHGCHARGAGEALAATAEAATAAR